MNTASAPFANERRGQTKDITEYTPAIITNESIRFIIPLYQRLFAWTPKEVKALLKDIADHLNSNDAAEPYYFGIITQFAEDSGREALVDGQQRMTVLMLMAIVFMNTPSLKCKTEWSSFWDGGERLELFARPEDKDFLASLASTQISPDHDGVNKLMLAAFNAIKDFVGALDAAKIERFASFIYTKLTILVSSLPKEYAKRPMFLNRHFESMNSEGRNLEQHEVLKVMLPARTNIEKKDHLFQTWNFCSDFSKSILRQSKQKGKSPEDEELVDIGKTISWAKGDSRPQVEDIDEITGKIENEKNGQPSDEYQEIGSISAKKRSFNSAPFRGDRSIVNFPQFLLLALNLFILHKNGVRNKAEIRKARKQRPFFQHEKIFENFMTRLKREDTVEFYEFMLRVRAILDYYVIRRAEDDDYVLYCGSKKGEKGNKGDDTIGWPEKLRQYQAMLFVSSNEYYEWLFEYLYMLILKTDDTKKPPEPQFLLGWLKKWDNDYRLSPYRLRNRTQKARLRRMRSSAVLSFPNVERYIFWRLDYYLWERLIDADNPEEIYPDRNIRKAVKEYTFRQNRSREHLHPQNESQLPPAEKWDNANKINSFGNLALISSSSNSAQGNNPIGVKFARLKEQIKSSSLESIKILEMYLAPEKFKLDTEDPWPWEAAERHREDMIQILNSSFADPLRNVKMLRPKKKSNFLRKKCKNQLRYRSISDIQNDELLKQAEKHPF